MSFTFLVNNIKHRRNKKSSHKEVAIRYFNINALHLRALLIIMFLTGRKITTDLLKIGIDTLLIHNSSFQLKCTQYYFP